MNYRAAALLSLLSVTATGCFVPEDASPTVGLGGEFATKFVHRGMVNVARPVFQPSMSVSLPTENGDSVSFIARGNMDLQNDNGKAWFPNGHAGRFSQIDFLGTYSHQLTDNINIRGGLFSYNGGNGQEFPKNRDGSGPATRPQAGQGAAPASDRGHTPGGQRRCCAATRRRLWRQQR